MKKSKKMSKAKYFNRFGMSGAALGLVLAPTLVAASCGGSSTEDPDYINNDGISQWTKSADVKTDLWGINSLGGSKSDQSFNQQTYDVVRTFTGIDNRFVVGTDTQSLEPSYATARSGNARLIATSGFDHITPIKKIVRNGGSGIGLYGDVRWILIDGVVASGYVTSVTFQSEQAAFLAGFLSADRAKELDPVKPVVSTYGGQDFPTVTSFMAGFQQGVKAYNDWAAIKAPGTPRVGFYVPSPLFVNSFDKNPPSLESNVTTMFEDSDKSVDVLLPVAGPQGITIAGYFPKHANWQGKKQIVGVDTDLKALFSADTKTQIEANAVYTSIQKNIATVLTSLLNNIYGTNVAVPGTYTPATAATTALLDSIKNTPSTVKGQDGTFFGRTINGGYAQNFVSVSNETSLFDAMKTKLTAAEKTELVTKATAASSVFNKDLAV